MRLKDKTAIITGSSRGIGKEIAILFAQEGAEIVLNDIIMDYDLSSNNSLMDLMGQIKNLGRRCAYVKADVSQELEVNHLVQKTVSEFGKIDILINNAGISPKKEGKKVPIFQLDKEEWDHVFAVNMDGVFLCSKAVLPYMMQNKGGKIINISSMDGKTGGFSVSAHYAASKAAVITFTKTLAREAAPYGIYVNCIAPGCIATEMLLNRPKEIIDSYNQYIPLGRIGKTSEVATVALFLATDASSYITGATIDVNGGWIMD
jgi:3-oxoacyl-[acyl-carrier protein] reductase